MLVWRSNVIHTATSNSATRVRTLGHTAVVSIQDLLSRRRQRELAGDARAGSWARARARTDQRAFLRAHWRPYCLAMVVMLAPGVLVAAFMPNAFLRGLVLGVLLAAVPGALWVWTVQVTGTAPVMMGDQAEQWTAAELRKLRRHGWRVVNHFLLRNDDIDHILIGPGGAYAIETKWSASPWESDFGRARQRDAIRQVTANARLTSLWHPLRKFTINAEPVVVLWGGDVKNWTPPNSIQVKEGVLVVAGPALSTWLASLGGEVLQPSQINDVWTAIETHLARRDSHDQLAHPLPASVTEIATRTLLSGAAVLLGFLFLGQVLRWTNSVAWTVGAGTASIGVALALSRIRKVRPASIGWSLGVGIPVGAILAAEGLKLLA